MNPRQKRKRQAGFTILEVIVVVAIIGMLSVLTLESMRFWGPRFELRQTGTQLSQLITKARIEAIKRGVTTVVEAKLTERRIIAFADVNGDPANPNQVGALYLVHDPNPLVRFDRTDYMIGEMDLPGKLETGVQFGDPVNGIHGADSVYGLTTVTVGDPGVLVFHSTGVVEDPGAFRWVDSTAANYFEANVASIMGKVEIRKYLQALDSPNGTAGFFPESNTTFDTTGASSTVGKNIWVWY